MKFKMERGEGDERKCESSWSSFALYELQSKAIQLLNGMDDGALRGGRVVGTFPQLASQVGAELLFFHIL